MVAVVTHKPGTSGKKYRIATEKDMEIFQEAEACLQEKREKLMMAWGMDPVPDESLPAKESHRAVGSQLPLYNFKNWGDLFNARQKLALITFAEKVKHAYQKMMKDGVNEDYAKPLGSFLAFILDRLASFSTNLCRWKSGTEQNIPMFSGRNALPMVMDYFEVNTIGKISTGWESCIKAVVQLFKNIKNDFSDSTVTQYSATSLLYEDSFFDAVFTDPPYYDNVPYSYLSDFFYVWLKRTLGDIHPELFSTPLTPKKSEIVAYSHGTGGFEEGKKFFEDHLKKSFQEIHRVLKLNGLAVIVYAHKSTEGWETLINSLLDSGLIVTGAWPLHTEMKSRMNAKETASLASSIYIVARKMERQPTGFYTEVRQELESHLNKKLEQLWQEGIGGADFFIAAIGSGIEVFGKYEQVMDYEGNIIRADRMLEDVRRISTDYAVHQILHNGFSGEISDLTRFYVLWRWEYKAAKVAFDDARKLAATCSVDLSHEWNQRRGFIRKDKAFIRVLGPQDRVIKDMKDSSELIEILHQTLLLWEKGSRTEMVQFLQDSGYGQTEAFFRVAQAISETLPIDNKEKKLLDGFLSGRERLKDDMREVQKQGELFK